MCLFRFLNKMMDTIFDAIKEEREAFRRFEEAEQQRQEELIRQQEQHQLDQIRKYADWYMTGIQEFLNKLSAENFHSDMGFETHPYLDDHAPFTSLLSIEGENCIYDFPAVKGVSFDNKTRQMLYYQIQSGCRAQYLKGAKKPKNLVSYRLIPYDSILKAEAEKIYERDTIYSNQPAIDQAITGGIIDGITGGKAGLYMALNAPPPVVFSSNLLKGIRLEITTKVPGLERILFRSYERYDDLVGDTVFRACRNGVFSDTPYHLKTVDTRRKCGTKKDFILGLGPYVPYYELKGCSCKTDFPARACLAVTTGYCEEFARKINLII